MSQKPKAAISVGGVAGDFFSSPPLLCVDKLWNQVKWCVIKLTLQKLISIGLRWRQVADKSSIDLGIIDRSLKIECLTIQFENLLQKLA